MRTQIIFRIMVVFLVVFGLSNAIAQPSNTGAITPIDDNGNPVSVQYGLDKVANRYRPLGLTGAVFDSMKVDTLMGIPEEGRGMKLSNSNTGTQSGFVMRNTDTTSTYMIRLVPSCGSPITMAPGTSFWVPFRADCLWVAPISNPPKFEVHTGAVQ